jgi:hypothetical protein
MVFYFIVTEFKLSTWIVFLYFDIYYIYYFYRILTNTSTTQQLKHSPYFLLATFPYRFSIKSVLIYLN